MTLSGLRTTDHWRTTSGNINIRKLYVYFVYFKPYVYFVYFKLYVYFEWSPPVPLKNDARVTLENSTILGMQIISRVAAGACAMFFAYLSMR